MIKPNKAVALMPLAENELLGRNRSNALIAMFNAFVNGTVVLEDPPEILFSDKNIIIKIGRGGAGSPDDGSDTGGNVALTQLRFKSYHANYLTCRTWDGTTEGGTDIYVSVAFKMLEVTSETIDGDTYNYSYSNDGNGNRVRTVAKASDSAFFEQQMIIPRLLTNDLILATSIPAGYTSQTSPTPTLVDMNVDSRAWCGVNGSATTFANL